MAFLETTLDNVLNHKANMAFPNMYAGGQYRSWNSTDEHFNVMHKVLMTHQPTTLLECGTFEGRFTEFAANVMSQYKSGTPKKIVTIDLGVWADIWIDKWAVKEMDANFLEVAKIRAERLDKTRKAFTSVEVIYVEGLCSEVIPQVMKTDKFDFVYEDATHVPHIMWNEMEIMLKAGGLAEDAVICWDDINATMDFTRMVKENLPDWYEQVVLRQYWMQKKG